MVGIAKDAAYWDERYASENTSGAGSYGAPMLRKVEWLSRLKRIQSVVEIGSGDFNFGEHLMKRFPQATYHGFDISEVIVQRNRLEHSNAQIRFDTFQWRIPAGSDLLLCVDVLFHITDDVEQEWMLRLLERGWRKYLALSAYEYDGYRRGHINIRRFDPSRFGKPILREVIEDDGQMYFYIFER